MVRGLRFATKRRSPGSIWFRVAVHFLLTSVICALRLHDFFVRDRSTMERCLACEAEAVGTVERCLACEAEAVGTMDGSRFDACAVTTRFFVVWRTRTGKRESHRKTSG